MNIEETGSGHAVILLHGCPTSIRYFDPLVAALAPHARVLVPEYPGYGKTPPLPRGAPLEVSEAMLLAELQRRGIDEVSLVGFSLGAYRALSLAVGGKIRVRSVVTLGGFAAFTPEHHAGLAALADQVEKMRDLSEPTFRSSIATLMLSPEFALAHPHSLAAIAAWLDATTPMPWADEIRAAIGAPDLHHRLGTLETPITARVGLLDAAAPPDYSRRLVAAARHATLQLVPGAGHSLLIEDREATIAAVKAAIEAPHRAVRVA